MRILGICGSLQATSSNRALLEVAETLVPEGIELSLFDGLRHLPHFDPDLDRAGPPESVLGFRAALVESQGVLIATPEYGFSLPGVLKNAIDWVIPSGELAGKPVAITAAAASAERGRMGLQALAQTLGAVSAVIVGGEPTVRGPHFEQDIASLLGALVGTMRESRPRFVVD